MYEYKNFKCGDQVMVYSAMYPQRDYKGTDIIQSIGPSCEGGEVLLWLEHNGAWHPDACSKVKEISE